MTKNAKVNKWSIYWYRKSFQQIVFLSVTDILHIFYTYFFFYFKYQLEFNTNDIYIVLTSFIDRVIAIERKEGSSSPTNQMLHIIKIKYGHVDKYKDIKHSKIETKKNWL